ncbi:MAG: endo-1,4-beta-xylanase [Verrucomicrobiota bacterium]
MRPAHKFIPHLHLGESPFPRDYNERGVYYHGGMATAIEAGLPSDEEVQESLQQMRQNVKAAGAATIGLTVFPPYPKGFFKNPGMSEPYSYQNGGDWCWFGGRMVQQLALRGRVTDAYQELRPMVERVQRHGFHEWWSRDNQPRGSGQFRGSAGVLARAIEHLEEWAVAKTGAGLQRAAGDLRIKTVGVATGTGWNLFSNGAVGEYLQLPTEGAYRLVVRAWGSPCQGQWPEMALRIDGEQVRAQTVRTAQAAAYEFRLTLPAGAHILTLAFLNDAIADGQDRNLYLGGIECSSLSGDPQPSLADPADLTRDAARLEAEVLAESDGQIERLRKGNTILRLIDAQGRPLANTRVAVEQRRHAFLFGGNLYGFDRFKTAGENDEYRRRFAALFNYATLPFYWRSYEPVPGQPLYAWTDKMVDWCQENQIRMKGHPLLWAEEAGIPRWSQGQPSPERQKQRVEEIMGRYRDKIRFYEVVNEPSHLAGLEIDSPYHWARAADPNAVLIVNDYHVLADGQRPFYRLLEQAIERDVPFDGIGIQAHEPRTERFPLPRVKRILDQYARLGKGLHITEFTPASSREPITGSQVTGLWTEEAQAEYATRFYRICFAHPAVAAITWWDLCDAHSWLKGGGMLRVDLTPKPVYDGLRQLIHRQWHTQVEGTTDASGRLALRGFFGDYQVSIQEPRLSGAFQLTRSGNEEIEVRCRAN